MPQPPRSSNSDQRVEKSISKGVKKVIAESGINPSTRRGNKELSYLIKRLAKQPIRDLKVATQIGEDLGQKLIALSRQLGRENLDQGVIRKLAISGDLPTIAELPGSEAQSHSTTSVQPREEESAIKKQTEQASSNALVDIDKDQEPDTTIVTDSEATALEELEEAEISAEDEDRDEVDEVQNSANKDEDEDEDIANEIKNLVEEEDESKSSVETEAIETEAVETDEATVLDDGETDVEQSEAPQLEAAEVEQTTALEDNTDPDLEEDVESLEGAVAEAVANAESQPEDEIKDSEEDEVIATVDA